MGFHYSLYRQDRNRHGCGMAIVISSCIPYRPHLDLSSRQTESIWGNFTLKVNVPWCRVVLIDHLLK